MNHDITAYLAEMNELDRQIISLLGRRFQLARSLALARKACAMRLIDHERELSTLEKIFALNREYYGAVSIVAVFRKIVEESRAVELKAGASPDQPDQERAARGN